MWAPPPFTAQHSAPLLTSEAGWPATAPALYNLSAHDYVTPPLDFEGFMRMVDATGAEPYIVLNLAGKSNMEPADSARFNASVLKAGAAAWLGHIRARGYNVTRFELTNEAYNQMPVAAYAAAVLDWAPTLRAALPGALLGASGPSFIDAVGKQARAASVPTLPNPSPARRPAQARAATRRGARARLPRACPRPHPRSVLHGPAPRRAAARQRMNAHGTPAQYQRGEKRVRAAAGRGAGVVAGAAGQGGARGGLPGGPPLPRVRLGLPRLCLWQHRPQWRGASPTLSLLYAACHRILSPYPNQIPSP